MRPATIPRLPDLAIFEICRHLDFSDVMAMSMVSHQFAVITQMTGEFQTESYPEQVVDSIKTTLNGSRGGALRFLVPLMSKMTPTKDEETRMQPMMMSLSMIQQIEAYRLPNNLIDHAAWHKGLRVMSLHLPWNDEDAEEPLFTLMKDPEYFPNMDVLKLMIKLSKQGSPDSDWDDCVNDEKWYASMPNVDIGDRPLSLLQVTYNKQNYLSSSSISPVIRAHATKRLEISCGIDLMYPMLYTRALEHLTARPVDVVRFLKNILPPVSGDLAPDLVASMSLDNLHTISIAYSERRFGGNTVAKYVEALNKVKHAIPSLTDFMYVPIYDANSRANCLGLPSIPGFNTVMMGNNYQHKEWFSDAYTYETKMVESGLFAHSAK